MPGKPKKRPVDATGRLPDGTELRSVVDLKQWLMEHPEAFASCLAEKLLTFATGRHPNHRERAIVADLVSVEHDRHGLRLKDLILALVESRLFAISDSGEALRHN